MMIYNPGDIVEVPFPFIDSSERKVRPALVLSEPEFVRSTGACVLMMITSATRSRWESDVVINDWASAGLHKPSILRWKLFTLENSMILARRGTLCKDDFNSLKHSFKSVLGSFCS